MIFCAGCDRTPEEGCEADCPADAIRDALAFFDAFPEEPDDANAVRVRDRLRAALARMEAIEGCY